MAWQFFVHSKTNYVCITLGFFVFFSLVGLMPQNTQISKKKKKKEGKCPMKTNYVPDSNTKKKLTLTF